MGCTGTWWSSTPGRWTGVGRRSATPVAGWPVTSSGGKYDVVQGLDINDFSRERIDASVKELEEGLAPELTAELQRLSLPFTDEDLPSEAELRVAQAQLVGWLEGLFHGIQTTLFAQQMAARAQLEQMRRALPPGVIPAEQQDAQPLRGSGPYL